MRGTGVAHVTPRDSYRLFFGVTLMRTWNVVAAVGAIALSAAMAGPVSASPLHGFCNGTGTGTCMDNGMNTPLGGSTAFGFTYSGSSSVTGTLWLDILLPNNDATPASFSVTGINGVTGGTATEVSTTAWTSGSLAHYLGISASPNNPLGAFLDSSETSLDASATGFFVYQLTLTDFTVPKNGSGGLPQFDAISGLDLGSYIVGFLDCGNSWCATANSGALLVDGTTTSVPEPASLALFAVGLGGLAFAVRRRRKAAHLN